MKASFYGFPKPIRKAVFDSTKVILSLHCYLSVAVCLTDLCYVRNSKLPNLSSSLGSYNGNSSKMTGFGSSNYGSSSGMSLRCSGIPLVLAGISVLGVNL